MSRLLREKKVITINETLSFGEKPVMIAGPCTIESYEQFYETAKGLKAIGVDVLRGGAFKPRTSPYAFQGLGEEGLEIMSRVGRELNIPVVSELMDETNLAMFENYVDILQVGSRNMYNYALLKVVGRTQKPVILKRGMSATIHEWIMAAEYIASHGNHNIILCERGIRTFDNYTRNTLDLTAVPIMKAETGLPVIVDPSHGTGRRELILPMSKAALACGADGLMVEVHYKPEEALCDGDQSLDLDMYREFYREVMSK
ncbi:MAG: 3-deoxy-7-phosphoheptulonate synthase [Clostridia bacterium]|nr:3-deoxy-7-phosphoheptulonate synthase [Clostridia bacterium]